MSTGIELSRTSGLVDLGTHTFKITERSSEEMGGSGYPYWRLICQVISSGDNQGKEVMYQLSLSPQSRFRMDEFLDGIDAPKKGKWTLEQCIGKKFRASVVHDTYEGKMRSNIQTVIPAADLQKSFDELPSEEAEAEDEALPDDVVEEEEEEKKSTGRRRKF